MTIRHLKIFIAVAETGSMSAAANRLYLTQPTVSQAVRDLETHYQVQLFERLHKKLFITEQGQQLLDMARMAVGNFDSLELSMQRFQERLSFRIGASLTVGTCLMSSVISDMENSCPKMDIYSFVSNTEEIEQKLLRRELDAAVVEGTIESPVWPPFPSWKILSSWSAVKTMNFIRKMLFTLLNWKGGNSQYGKRAAAPGSCLSSIFLPITYIYRLPGKPTAPVRS